MTSLQMSCNAGLKCKLAFKNIWDRAGWVVDVRFKGMAFLKPVLHHRICKLEIFLGGMY